MSSTREQMDSLAERITASIIAAPDDFDSREELWMQRENLRARLEGEARA